MEWIEKVRAASIISRKVKDELKAMITPESRVIDIVEYAESRIRELGADIAFPLNVSFDADAAHDTASPDDTRIIGNSLVKIDIGVHIDGWISDSAFSISFNPDYVDLIKASERALEEAVKIAKPGTKVSEIGQVIEETINRFGFKPVANLTGHGLGHYEFHADPQIFNIRNNSAYTLEENQLIAIEPFATDGRGYIKETGRSQIFSLAREIPVRSIEEREILGFAISRHGLPFSIRDVGNSPKRRFALMNLVRKGALYSYPVLREVENGLVSQTEHTVLVGENPEILS